ncbi:MAG: 6-deoxy-6-sulfogluconolactonase, partial [Frankiales bacterium]|nr:6-deoxy-6-sulfogluconolactonase [Frankiales bacterium]
MSPDVMPLLTGLKFPEAPRWHEGSLWFSDMVAGTVHRLQGGDRDNGVTTVARLDDKPGGIGFLPDGTPVVVGMHTAMLYTLDTGSAVPWVDLTAVADGHLDDMVIGADGVAWVGGVGHMSLTGPVPKNGRLLRVDSRGAATTAATDIAFPNGAALSADGRTLV